MTRCGIGGLLIAFLTLLAGLPSFGAGDGTNALESANFQEVYDTLRAHLKGVSEAELNRAAVEGLISTLGPKVWLRTNNASGNGTATKSLVSSTSILDSNIVY